AVGAVTVGSKDRYAMSSGRFAKFPVAPGNLSADRVLGMELKGLILEGVDHQLTDAPGEFFLELIKRLLVHRRLGKKDRLPVQVKGPDLLYRFDDDGFAVGMSDEADHFGMILLSVDHDLVSLAVNFP